MSTPTSPAHKQAAKQQYLAYRVFLNQKHDERLNMGLQGKLVRDFRARSIYWKYYLGILKVESSMQTLKNHRQNYQNLMDQHIVDPTKLADENLDPEISNPLSTDQESPWQKFWANQELEKTIIQDLDRIFPEFPFFHTDQVKQMMKRILLIWSKENEDTSYRQGMHELLAPFIIVAFRDSLNFESTAWNNFETPYDDIDLMEADRVLVSEIRKNKSKKHTPTETQMDLNTDYQLDEQYSELCSITSKEFLEHDCFAMFNRLMYKMKDFFLLKKKSTDASSDMPLQRICDHIQNSLLKKKDPELYEQLKSMGIEPQIYGLRWIRLLFGREFHLEDVFMIWDAIFADANGFRESSDEIKMELVQHISLVMLMNIRDFLLDNQSTDCLRRLMRYPPTDSVYFFIKKALKSKNDPSAKLFEFKKKSKPKPTVDNQTKQRPPLHLTPRRSPSPSSIVNTSNSSKPKKSSTGGGGLRSVLPSSKSSTDNFLQLISPNPKSTHTLSSIRDRDARIGKIMDQLLSILQSEIMSISSQVELDDAIYLSIAELKHFKDILLDHVNDDSSDIVERGWIKEYKKRKSESNKTQQQRDDDDGTQPSEQDSNVPPLIIPNESNPVVEETNELLDPLEHVVVTKSENSASVSSVHHQQQVKSPIRKPKPLGQL